LISTTIRFRNWNPVCYRLAGLIDIANRNTRPVIHSKIRRLRGAPVLRELVLFGAIMRE
jgi:hypothetical protein